MTARDNPNLGPQFYRPEEVGQLHATDFAGTIGHRDAEERLLQANTESWGSRDAAMTRLNAVRDETMEHSGHFFEPVAVVHHPDGRQAIWDGHHRALTAHQFDLELPVKHYTLDEMKHRG